MRRQGLGQVTNQLTMPPEERRGHQGPASQSSSQGFSFFPVTRESAHGWGICNSLISTRHRTSFNTRGFTGDSARTHRFKAMDRPSIPFVKCFPTETFGILFPLGFGVAGFSGGEVGWFGSEHSPSFPSGLGWGFLSGRPRGPISLDPPRRVSFPPPSSLSKGLPGKVSEQES